MTEYDRMREQKDAMLKRERDATLKPFNAEIDRLTAENERLRTALELYADAGRWEYNSRNFTWEYDVPGVRPLDRETKPYMPAREALEGTVRTDGKEGKA